MGLLRQSLRSFVCWTECVNDFFAYGSQADQQNPHTTFPAENPSFIPVLEVLSLLCLKPFKNLLFFDLPVSRLAADTGDHFKFEVLVMGKRGCLVAGDFEQYSECELCGSRSAIEISPLSFVVWSSSNCCSASRKFFLALRIHQTTWEEIQKRFRHFQDVKFANGIRNTKLLLCLSRW